MGPNDGLYKKRCGFSWVSQYNVCVPLATTAAPVPKLTPNMLVSTLDLWHIVSRLTWGRFFQPCLPIQSMTPNSHQSCGQTNDDLWTSAQIFTQSLHLSTTLKHLLKEQIISYPMHVSGHEMVEGVQRYACAKLIETIWLAGGWVFHGGDLVSVVILVQNMLMLSWMYIINFKKWVQKSERLTAI